MANLHGRIDALLGLPPLPLSEQYARKQRPKLQNAWRDLGRWLIPGRWFLHPVGSAINFVLYVLPSFYLGWTITSQGYSSTSIIWFIFTLFSAIFYVFLLLATIQALPVIAWAQLRNPALRRRILFFSLPYFLVLFPSLVQDTWAQSGQITISDILIYLGLSLLISLAAGTFLASMTHLLRLPLLTKQVFYWLLWISSLLSMLLVFVATLYIIRRLDGTAFSEYLAVITPNNVIIFLTVSIGLAPVAFLGSWWVYANVRLKQNIQAAREFIDGVIDLVKALNIDKWYFSFWKILPIPFFISLTFYILDYYWPDFHSLTHMENGTVNVVYYVLLAINIQCLSYIFALFLLLLRVTARYIFSPEAVNSIRIAPSKMFSSQIVKSVIILSLLFTAWWALHTLAIFQFHLEPTITLVTTEKNITLAEAVFYAFSLMTGFEVSNYQPANMSIRAYSIPVAITGIALLVIFLGVALGKQEEPQEIRNNSEPASAAKEITPKTNIRSRGVRKITKLRRHNRD